jgi:dethiobiotin synthetase
VAARLEGKSINGALLREGARWWNEKVELLLIEGVGGLLCPLSERETIADLAVDLGYPLLVVARLGLGTINHTLLTIEAARARKLSIAGIILNEAESTGDLAAESNEQELAKRTDVPVLGVLRSGSSTILKGGQPVNVDWRALADVQRLSAS